MLLVGVAIDAFAGDVEKALSHDLSECSRIVRRIADGSKSGIATADDISRLKKSAEAIHADRLLLAERQGTLAERAATLGGAAPDRQNAVSSTLLKNLDELLSLLDAIGTGVSSSDMDALKQILDILVPHKSRPLLGVLPYRHTNYPSREPSSSPVVKPAYKGGDRNVSAADTAATPEAPLSKEIVDLAQSLQWNPVLIYEWVKNNVATEWYWGSMKGAEETLRQKSGNDADQAALLVALLRAAGFPSRYIQGTIEFFPGMDKAKNLIGLDDPAKIYTFLQKAGIPVKPVIAGGAITNFQIAHIWVEAFIPYSNYRGAVIDDQGKIWLGLDTSIKPQGFTRTRGAGVPGGILSTLRDDYLGAVQTQSPLDYLTGKLNDSLAADQPGATWIDLKDSATLIPDILKIIPSSMQFNQIAITGEYQALPDELKHKLTLSATANSNELFSLTLDTHKLSNKRLALRAEPETVEDQTLIDSFGGLDNTPAYLVRLRPVLTLDGERLVVAQDGLSMGGDFTLNIDIITPNGTERISSSQIAGNLSVIGVAAQKAATPAAITEEDDAEAILHKESIGYIDRWNRAEDDLATLLGQSVSRPTVTIATVGAQLEVTWLMDTPHDIQWKGLFLDAGYKRLESVGRNGGERDFMRLCALQGSILENRIFEDDLKVDSISTAKLLQQAKAGGTPILSIDKTNVDSVLPTLTFDDVVKQDISNAVNQGLTVTIPQAEVAYLDWSGIGYVKEDPITGESGWMLSGQVAGGMSAAIQWVNDYLMAVLGSYNTKPSKNPPAKLLKVGATDRQNGTAGKDLKQKLAVLVTDKEGHPVANAMVTFKVLAGGGTITTAQPVKSSYKGIAAIDFTPGQKTGNNPIYFNLDPKDQQVTQAGLNIITATLETSSGSVGLQDPFEAYGIPDKPVSISKKFGDGSKTLVGNPAGSLQVVVLDQYGNPVSNVLVQYESKTPGIATQPQPPLPPITLPGSARNVTFYTPDSCSNPYPIYGDTGCSTFGFFQLRSGYDGCFVNTILGDAVNTKYTVQTSTPDYPNITPVAFTLYSQGNRPDGRYLPPALVARYLESYTSSGYPVNAVKTGKQLAAPLTAELLLITDDYSMSGPNVCTNPITGIPYDCWRIVPSGKSILTKVTTGNLNFKTTSGSGTVSATANLSDPTKPDNPNNGKYRAFFTAGSIPERDSIGATGTGKINVPVVFYDPTSNKAVEDGYTLDMLTSGTDKKQLLTNFIELPINKQVLFDKKTKALITGDTDKLADLTVYAVNTTLQVQPGVVYITKDGRAKRDTTFTYSILPADYRALITDIDIFTRDTKGVDTWIGTQPGDVVQGTGTNTILAGSSWDVRNKYMARVTLNNGSAIEIDGDMVPVNIGLGALVPDYNHNRQIDASDRERAELAGKYYFWVNDDDGSGDTEGTGIPASGPAVDPAHLKVDGTRDLVDFFPVHLDIKDLFEAYDPARYTYRLRNGDSALNYVVTDLKPTESGGYLTGENKDDVTGNAKGIDYVKAMGDAPTFSITNTDFNALTGPMLALKPEVVEYIKQDKGVILIEAYKKATSPLVLEVYDGTTLVYSSLKLDLSINGVEQMFRHKNLVQDGGGPPPNSLLNYGAADRLVEPANFPDSEANDKHFVFVHGYNVNGEQARGWNAEMFKRMYWSGSRAKFWGVTWYGWDTQDLSIVTLPFTRNFHINVQHALKTAPAFSDFINLPVGGKNVTVAAHSLGNMLVSSAIAEQDAKVDNYLLIDAAVPIEAYDGTVARPQDTSFPDSTNNSMIPPEWKGYNTGLFASEWYRLFENDDPIDERRNLTWRGRFASIVTNTQAYNFYSSGEDVLDNHEGIPFVPDIFTEGVGRFAWGLQEKLKGGLPTGWMLGSNYGGWRFDQGTYNESIVDAAGQTVNVPMLPDTVNNKLSNGEITIEDIKKQPFFILTGDDVALLQDYPIGSDYAKANRDRLLAEAIPALSLAVGRNKVAAFDEALPKTIRNIDMNLSLKNSWPAYRVDVKKSNDWWHSDIMVIAYPYIYSLFNKLTELVK